ncbi:hypothetical protein CEQ90_14630 [Lewinellaceae bacterium SD302]|nr:hypothetical protein CEQ90_14630 [Lewinellaceae bacterium SD302]
MSNCYVIFYSSDNYSSQSKRFDDPIEVPDASDYYYDTDSDKKLSDSIDSLKTGSQGWLTVFSKENYKGGLAKFYPNDNTPKLDDIYRFDSNDKGIGDTIESFILYDSCPNYFDIDDPVMTGQTWVKLYGDENYAGSGCNNYLHGAGNIPDNYFINLDSSKSVAMFFGVKSIITGPRTWLEIYNALDYGGDKTCIGPGLFIEDFDLFSSSSKRYSIKVYDSEPSGWVNSYEEPSIVIEMMQYSTTSKIESVVNDLIGMIPEVGDVIDTLMDILWPLGPDGSEVWHDLQYYIASVTQELMDEIAIKDLNNRLAGIHNLLTYIQQLNPSEDRLNDMKNLHDTIINERSNFLGGNNRTFPETQIAYQVAFSTIDLFTGWALAYKYEELRGEPCPADNEQVYISALDGDVAMYTRIILGDGTDEYPGSVEAAVAWRISPEMIYNQGDAVYDAYNGFVYSGVTVEEARNQVAEEYRKKLNLYIAPVELYQYLSSENISQGIRPVPVVEQFTTSMGDPNAQGASGTSQDDLNGNTITGVEIYTDSANQYVVGIQFFYSAQASGVHGQTTSTSVRADFEEGEFIVGFYGRSGSWLDQLFIRTNTGRDFGVGGPGGKPFYVATPQGVDAVLMSIEVNTCYSSYLSALILNFDIHTYE